MAEESLNRSKPRSIFVNKHDRGGNGVMVSSFDFKAHRVSLTKVSTTRDGPGSLPFPIRVHFVIKCKLLKLPRRTFANMTRIQAVRVSFSRSGTAHSPMSIKWYKMYSCHLYVYTVRRNTNTLERTRRSPCIMYLRISTVRDPRFVLLGPNFIQSVLYWVL